MGVARRQIRSIADLCEEFGARKQGAKRGNRNNEKNIKLELIRLFLCVARRQIRSIVNLCEEFGVRSKVQKESIKTILNYKPLKF